MPLPFLIACVLTEVGKAESKRRSRECRKWGREERSPSELAASTSKFKAGKRFSSEITGLFSTGHTTLFCQPTGDTVHRAHLVLLSKHRCYRVNQSCLAEAPSAATTRSLTHVNLPSAVPVSWQRRYTGIHVSVLSATRLPP